MSEREQASLRPIAALRAAVVGAALAAGGCLALRLSWVHALEVTAAGALALALIAHLRQRPSAVATRVPADRAERRWQALIACSSAGAALWALAPWAATQPAVSDTAAVPATSAPAREWLCHVSILATPYQQPRARALIVADGQRAAQLRICARARAEEPARVVAANPLAHHGRSTRALLRSEERKRYDLLLIAPTQPAHPFPLGPLPFADAPIETAEGVRDLIAGLTPDGVLAATVLGEPAALRWLHTARSALDALGVAQPTRHLVVYGAAGAYTLLLRHSPFDLDSTLALHSAQRRTLPDAPAELDRWPAWLRTRPRLLATPGAAFDNRIATELVAPDFERAADLYAFDIHAATDDRPLFFESTRRDRTDTWSAGVSYRVLPARIAFAAVLAALLALVATRRCTPALRVRERLQATVGYGALAVGHALGYACAQHALGLWLPLASHAPALCALVLGGSAGVWVAPASLIGAARRRGLTGLLLQLTAAGTLAALGRVDAPTPELATRAGSAGLAWLALLALCALGAAVALGARAQIRHTAEALRPRAHVIYLAWLAPGVLLAPALVLASGYRSCALWGAGALALAALLAPAARRA